MNSLRVVILGAILIASLGACSSAGKCKRGELGCACHQTDKSCEPGASCVAERCTTSSGSGGSGGSSSGSGGRDSSTAGSDATDSCPATSFDAACHSFCTAFCESQRAFCLHSACKPGDCDSSNYIARPVCEEHCRDDAVCVRQLCLDLGSITCETFFSPKNDGGVDPYCFDNDPRCELDSN